MGIAKVLDDTSEETEPKYRGGHENMQNLINAFMKETGENEQTAIFYIDSSSNDLNSAIELFKVTKENN